CCGHVDLAAARVTGAHLHAVLIPRLDHDLAAEVIDVEAGATLHGERGVPGTLSLSLTPPLSLMDVVPLGEGQCDGRQCCEYHLHVVRALSSLSSSDPLPARWRAAAARFSAASYWRDAGSGNCCLDRASARAAPARSRGR